MSGRYKDYELFWCEEVPGAVCCFSCHEDFNSGYDQHIELYEPEGKGLLLHCCSVEIPSGEKLRDLFKEMRKAREESARNITPKD